MTARVADFFLPKPTPSSTASSELSTSAVNLVCPEMDIRQGASTLTVPPGSTEAFSLRYQGTIGEMARECNVTGGVMRMKIGVQGRVLVGPAGGPGKLDVPLRYAIVSEGPEPKTIVSKFYKVPVTIGEGQPNVAFAHIDEEVAFPMPAGLDIHSYVVYVGFDPAGEKQQGGKPAAKPAPKPTPARPR
jgi:hypothetical protein